MRGQWGQRASVSRAAETLSTVGKQTAVVTDRPRLGRGPPGRSMAPQRVVRGQPAEDLHCHRQLVRPTRVRFIEIIAPVVKTGRSGESSSDCFARRTLSRSAREGDQRMPALEIARSFRSAARPQPFDHKRVYSGGLTFNVASGGNELADSTRNSCSETTTLSSARVTVNFT